MKKGKTVQDGIEEGIGKKNEKGKERAEGMGKA